MAVDASMVELFKSNLELCKVRPGQTVAVLSEGEARADYAQAFLAASQQLARIARRSPARARAWTGESPPMDPVHP